MKEIIRKIEAFSGLDDRLLTRLADTAITCTYSRDELMIREGEVGIGMYYVLRGRLAVFRTVSGAEVRLGEIGPHEFVAEMALLDEKPRSASVVTIEESECVLFTRDTVRHLLEHHPTLSMRLIRVMAERLRTAQDRPIIPGAPVTSDAVLPPAAAPSANGTHPNAMKASVEKKLLDLFERLYTAKAFTRFSVAILGCPVEGSGADALEIIRIGDVKAVVLPASGPAELQIGAYGAGQFQLHVFHPALFGDGPPRALRFDPVPIQPDDRFTLSLPSAVLTRHAPSAAGALP